MKDGEYFLAFLKDNKKMDKCNKVVKKIQSFHGSKRMRKVKKRNPRREDRRLNH